MEKRKALAAQRCDFCNGPHPHWDYPCETFIALTVVKSLDSWLACDACHSLIDARDWVGLARRAAAQEWSSKPGDAELYYLIHSQFRTRRKGQPTRFGTS